MENSYKKVWINAEWKALIRRGLEKIGKALELLEHSRPGCSDRYYSITSVHFRRKAAEQAGDLSVSVFNIYCWLVRLFDCRPGCPYPPLKEAVKEAAIHGKIKQKQKHRKTPFLVKNRAVCNRIPSHEERSEDYINGVKYRVIIYFGRNVK